MQVRATNSAKEGPYATRSLSIVILPPWWQSVWAYFLYIIWGILCRTLLVLFGIEDAKRKQMEEKAEVYLKLEGEKNSMNQKVSFLLLK